ncbi:serine hydrolase domain-containing protein [Streptomyces sp. NRRL S-87]|uniref:serine hydrolase domain-containing protein n=1 Tax=Streptomyces sp. NRRL S-87 TaxID=1463920 RepID=UPI00068AF06D|nr:serine hydrolase domain-containing protein [Streptomyces sp. NRRL S-87]
MGEAEDKDGVSGRLSRRRLAGHLLALGGVLGGVLAAQSLPGAAAARGTGPDGGRGGPDGGHGTGPEGGPDGGPDGGSGGPGRRWGVPGGWRSLRYGSAREAGLLEEHLDAALDETRRFLGPSPTHPWYAGAVVLAGRGRTVALHEAVGDALRYADYDGRTDTARELPPAERIPMRRDTVFDLASLTKLFTSVLAVQQLERGALELEAPVDRYLPEFTGGGKELITVRQLLTHTSGLRSWVPFYRESTREGQLGLLWQVRPQDPPGSVYRYSDLNLIALHLLLERVTGSTLDVLLRDEITIPLGMHRTRFRPPAAWRPLTAATEVERPPWSGLDRGLVWGAVHDENAHTLGGVAGHAGVFGTAWDLAVLARTLLDGGAYGAVRILSAASVELLFTDFNTAFPGDDHGLGFELYQHWYMGAMATPHAAGHTGFTGTSLVLDPSTDSYLILLGNSVHPVRTWRAGSAPRVAVANAVARAVPVRTAHGGPAWYSGMATGGTGTLTLPALGPLGAHARLECDLWWDTVPRDGSAHLEASVDGGGSWEPVPFDTVPLASVRFDAGSLGAGSSGGGSSGGGSSGAGSSGAGSSGAGSSGAVRSGAVRSGAVRSGAVSSGTVSPAHGVGREQWPQGMVTGWSGRVWHRLTAPLERWADEELRLRFRHRAEGRYVGRGVYVDRIRVRVGARDGGRAEVPDGGRAEARDEGRAEVRDEGRVAAGAGAELGGGGGEPIVFSDERPADAARLVAVGWTRSAD